ncbi:MAG: nitrile hydratase accessory protein [Rhodospirillaceae bacterium]
MIKPQSFEGLLPKTMDEPLFSEPWQAQAFALTVTLHSSGLFTWDEWAETLGGEIAKDKEHGENIDSSNYYSLWLSALESLVAVKGAITMADLLALREAWKENYLTTPHGQPIPEPDI